MLVAAAARRRRWRAPVQNRCVWRRFGGTAYGRGKSGICYLSALADVAMSFFTGQIYRIFVYSYSFSLDACKCVTYNGFIKFIGGWETERAAGDSRQRGKEGFL